MTELLDPTELSFEELPIDSDRGFPQDFTHVLGNTAYRFRLYANLEATQVTDEVEFFDLPSAAGHLVARVQRQGAGEEPETIFLRKVVPGVTYLAQKIALQFPEQRVARANLNGRGSSGSRVTGRIAQRWA